MEQSSLKRTTQEGPGNGESLSTPSGVDSPTYSGGGTNCFVGQPSKADSREHDYCKTSNKDSDFTNDLVNVDLEVQACAMKAHALPIDSGTKKANFQPRVVLERIQASTIHASSVTRRGSLWAQSTGGDDSDTLMNVSEDNSRTKLYRKKVSRKRTASEVEVAPTDSESLVSDVSDKGRKKTTSAKRGRGRAVAVGHSSGLAEAKRQLSAIKKQQVQMELEERVENEERRARVNRAKLGYGVDPMRAGHEEKMISELERLAKEDVEEICLIASKCSNIKGTIQKSLKDRARSILAIALEMGKRSVSEETLKLQATVDRLQAEVEKLRKDQTGLLEKMKNSAVPEKIATSTSAPAISATPTIVSAHIPTDWEETIRKIIQEERSFTRACIAGIEDRLLPESRMRPTLAADSKTKNGPREFKVPAAPTKKPTKGESVRAAEKAQPYLTVATPGPSKAPNHEMDVMLPSTTPVNNEWVTVAKKKGKKSREITKDTVQPVKKSAEQISKSVSNKVNAGVATAKKVAATTEKRIVKLTPPKSAAVMVTLTAQAVARGETYETVLKKARESIDPAQLGIGQSRVRRTQTGARLFEFPGAQNGALADTFAAKLREAVADSAKVIRPTKFASLVITDIDDSVSKAEVLMKIAEVGQCEVDAIRASEIHTGRGGMGIVRLQCPVAAAKLVMERGRVFIGFSSVRIKAVENPPLRCHKCFGIGHTRACCPSASDRSSLCCRCGVAGHKAAFCKEKPHCALCAESGRPSGHFMGGKSCKPPSKKGKWQIAQVQSAIAATIPPVAADVVMIE